MSEQNEKTLKQIVKEYLSKKYLYEEMNKPTQGPSGNKWNFDGIVTYNEEKFGVFVKDWNRSIGVNQVRLLEKACIDMGYSGGLLIGRNFSGHAWVYGQSKGVQMVTRSEIINKNHF